MADFSPHRSWRIVHSEASLGWGGQEHRILAELQGFRRRGHNVWLLAPPYSQIFQHAQADGIACEPADFTRWKFPYEALRITRWLRRIRPHVVNPHSSRDAWLVGVVARLARTPLIIRSRHIDVTYPNAWISRHVFTTFADHVLTTSDKITGHLRARFALPAEHITTVPTGIDLLRFSPRVTPVALPRLGGEPHWPTVGMVSVLRSWKGHATFFAAARRLREQGRQINFVVVGGGAPLEAYQAMARGAGADFVAFAGHREDVPGVLRALSLLAIPSTHHEGIPQIGLQALACETPVIGSDCGGIPEVIRPGQTGRIFRAGDVAALAECVAEALDEPGETRRLAAGGRQFVEDRHGLDVMLDQVEEIYRRYLPARQA